VVGGGIFDVLERVRENKALSRTSNSSYHPQSLLKRDSGDLINVQSPIPNPHPRRVATRKVSLRMGIGDWGLNIDHP
jgi:hypothetical protein